MLYNNSMAYSEYYFELFINSKVKFLSIVEENIQVKERSEKEKYFRKLFDSVQVRELCSQNMKMVTYHFFIFISFEVSYL